MILVCLPRRHKLLKLTARSSLTLFLRYPKSCILHYGASAFRTHLPTRHSSKSVISSKDTIRYRLPQQRASFAFRNCVQKPAERLIDFSNRLKRAPVPCGFGEHLDRALKDQFVVSLCDQDIKRKIPKTPDEDTQTFNNVFKLAEREERTILHSRQLSTSASTATSSATSTCSTSVNKIRHDYHGNKPKSAAAHAGGAVPKPQRSTAATPSSSSRHRRQCYRCSSDPHLANKCPHSGSKCSYCHKIGHLEHACLSKKRASGQSRIHHLHAEVDSGEVFPELPDDCEFGLLEHS